MWNALARIGASLRALSGWRANLAAWIAGLVSALAFAPIGLSLGLLLALATLVLLLDGAQARPRPIRHSAILGWFFGFGQFLAGLYWVGYAFTVDPSAHGWQLPFAILILTGGLALFPTAAAAIHGALWREGSGRIFMFAVLFSLAEWLRGHVLTGFPWNIAAYGWDSALAILQSASVLGAYGLSALTIFFGAALAELTAPRGRRLLPAGAAVLFALIWIAGMLRLEQNPTTYVPGVELRLVQPDVPQAEKFKREYVLRNWEELLKLSAEPAKKPITHLIWPEAAPPFFLEREPIALDEIAKLTRRHESLLTGAERAEYGPDGAFRYFNSLYVFGDGGRLLSIYDKFHLVPFGEYVPFARLLNKIGITKLTAGEVGFSSGDGPHTIQVPAAPPVSPLICYEILFPGAVVGTQRPGWFVNVTDDSWFGPSTGPYQHLLTARVRAIEEGLPVARDANTGISAVIDPLGRTIATLPLDEMGVLDAPLPKAIAAPLYARLGDSVFWLLIAIGGAVGWLFRRK